MNNISALLLLSLSAGVCHAADVSLRVTLNDGSSETYSIDKRPRISFDMTDMIVSSEQFSSSYARTDIRSCDFVSGATSTVDASVARETVYRFENDDFCCEGGYITVYTPHGAVVAQGRNRISLATLAKGLYIINVNNKSIKYFKR